MLVSFIIKERQAIREINQLQVTEIQMIVLNNTIRIHHMHCQ
jgi:hypothetical protein